MSERLKDILVYLLLGGLLLTYGHALRSRELLDTATLKSLDDVRISQRKLQFTVEYLEAKLNSHDRRLECSTGCRVLRKQPLCSE